MQGGNLDGQQHLRPSGHAGDTRLDSKYGGRSNAGRNDAQQYSRNKRKTRSTLSFPCSLEQEQKQEEEQEQKQEEEQEQDISKISKKSFL